MLFYKIYCSFKIEGAMNLLSRQVAIIIIILTFLISNYYFY